MRLNSLARRLTLLGGISLLLCETSWTQTVGCDLNGDGAVNAVDVQLIIDMEIGATACSANIGGVLACTDSARQVVVKAALSSPANACHFIALSWTASTSSGVTGYNIYRGTASGAESLTPVNTGGPVTGTSFADVNTVTGTVYYYVVKATNGSIESTPSAEASATAL